MDSQNSTQPLEDEARRDKIMLLPTRTLTSLPTALTPLRTVPTPLHTTSQPIEEIQFNKHLINDNQTSSFIRNKARAHFVQNSDGCQCNLNDLKVFIKSKLYLYATLLFCYCILS